jgi:[protein-PII] uridylyltransferase
LAALSFPRTEEVDRVVKAAADEHLASGISTAFAVLGVGGYGRGELFPYSDVDLLILLEREPDARAKEPLSQFLRALWDSFVKASHSVRTVDECCQLHENNVHLSISLLDVRFLSGSAELFDSLTGKLREFFKRHSRPLLRGLSDLTTSRHAKFNNTVYRLEPNIKESPGGIRDIHFLQWASQLAPDKEPLRHAAAEVADAREFLYRLRFFLHQQSGRDNNLLSFELQDQAAEVLPPEPLKPEDWMRDYYRHARSCFQPSLQALDFISRGEAGLVRQFLDRRDRLSTAEFTVAHNRVLLRNPGATLASLRSLFSLFIFVGRHGIPLSWDAERRVRERIAALAEQPAEKLGWSDWHALLEQPNAALALHNMQDCNVLTAALAPWKSIDSLVVRDFYHRYTVDEHTLVAIESIDDLLRTKDEKLSRFRQLAVDGNDLALLRMAILLHDIGKGTTPGDHIVGSCETATEFLGAIGTPEAEQRVVQFLIKHHLDLSLVMNGRDLDDPATARFLSSQIGTYEDLRKLTLLTYADVSAVNPTAMTPWRAEQLWRVHSVAAAQLTRELVSERIHQSEKAAASVPLRPELATFLEGFPTRYRRIHSDAQIEEHFRLEQLRLRAGVALEIHREPGAYALTVLAADQPGLFAAFCGSLASFGLNIVKAEAASNSSGCALDEFRFTDPARTLELNPEEMERLRWTVECVVRGAIEVSDLLKRRRPRGRSAASRMPSTIRFDDLASDSSTLLNFSGEDRPGLLFDLASALTEAECNIEVVLVNTEGDRAIDVLYVTRQGGKLDSPTQDHLRARLTWPS